MRALGVEVFGANHGRGPAAALAALAEMSAPGSALAALAERRARDVQRRPARVPARDAGVLRRVRGACACARRAGDRRLLRDDAGADRRDPRRGRRRTARRCAAPRVRERALEPLPAAAAEPTELERLLAVRRVRRLGAARSAARRLGAGADRGGGGGARVGARAGRRRERQPARAGADERADGVGRDSPRAPGSRSSRT